MVTRTVEDAGDPEDLYVTGRVEEATYLSKSFPLRAPGSDDEGVSARFMYRVFDEPSPTRLEQDGEEWIVYTSPKGRSQLKLLVAREAGHVREIWVHRVNRGRASTVLNLQGERAARFIDLVQSLPAIPIEGGKTTRVDDALLREVFGDPSAVARAYREDREAFRRLIADDATAHDVVAIAARREVVDRFRRLLNDPDYFDAEVEKTPRRSPERVWQRLFEANPWIFGVGLSGQFVTRWSDERLEQVVAGFSIGGPGKRADAVLRTAGRIRSMVFAEIKTHRLPLLDSEYRTGCWSVSSDVAGGVAQVHGTVARAVEQLGTRLQDVGEDGSDIAGQFTYLIKPRSFLVIGRLGELVGPAGGDHRDKIHSFELFRRNIDEPEIVTFDELIARAEWVVDTAEREV